MEWRPAVLARQVGEEPHDGGAPRVVVTPSVEEGYALPTQVSDGTVDVEHARVSVAAAVLGKIAAAHRQVNSLPHHVIEHGPCGLGGVPIVVAVVVALAVAPDAEREVGVAVGGR